MREHLTPAQNELASEMGWISEQAYCAGWTSGLEFFLWRFLSEGPGEFGCLDITQDHIDTLRSLSDACGGWIVWSDVLIDRAFVPLNEWQQRFDEWIIHKRNESSTLN
jgi:hypothetical protein